MRRLQTLTREFLESKRHFLLDRPLRDDHLLIGKFKTFHLGHRAMLDPGKKNTICIVGNIEAEELKLRADIIENTIRGAVDYEIVHHNDGYLPSIIYQTTRDMPTVACGEDRYESYLGMCKPFEVAEEAFMQTPRMMSSSDIIHMLSTGDVSQTIAHCPGLNNLDLLLAARTVYCS